jgi:hypothetical protein
MVNIRFVKISKRKVMSFRGRSPVRSKVMLGYGTFDVENIFLEGTIS